MQKVPDEELRAMASDFDAKMQATGQYPSIATAWEFGARAIRARILGGTK